MPVIAEKARFARTGLPRRRRPRWPARLRPSHHRWATPAPAVSATPTTTPETLANAAALTLKQGALDAEQTALDPKQGALDSLQRAATNARKSLPPAAGDPTPAPAATPATAPAEPVNVSGRPFHRPSHTRAQGSVGQGIAAGGRLAGAFRWGPRPIRM
jgi:hypothetical protein